MLKIDILKMQCSNKLKYFFWLKVGCFFEFELLSWLLDPDPDPEEEVVLLPGWYILTKGLLLEGEFLLGEFPLPLLLF